MTEQERQRLITKRTKLAALAERGIDGERDNAKRMLAEFDARHPQLIPATASRGRTIKVQTIINGQARIVELDTAQLAEFVAYWFALRRR